MPITYKGTFVLTEMPEGTIISPASDSALFVAPETRSRGSRNSSLKHHCLGGGIANAAPCFYVFCS